MAFTMNYGRMGMWSPAGIAKRKKIEAAIRQKENTAAKQAAWVKKFLADGGDFRKAGSEYTKHLNAIAKARRENYKLWKAAEQEKRLAKQRAKKAARSAPVPHREVPKAKPPPQRLHYRKGMPSAEFYRCWEWQTLRYQTLKRFGAKCLCCGAAGNHVDHIKPRSKYPALELDAENLQVLCEACNVGKSNLFEDDWRSRGLSPGPSVAE